MSSNVIRLHAADLFSKWGFGDGDVLDDLLMDADIDSPAKWAFEGVVGGAYEHCCVFEHCVLTAVVREFLIPAIPRSFKMHHSQTAHNSARADMDETTEGLDDIVVEVPHSEIIRIALGMITAASPTP